MEILLVVSLQKILRKAENLQKKYLRYPLGTELLMFKKYLFLLELGWYDLERYLLLEEKVVASNFRLLTKYPGRILDVESLSKDKIVKIMRLWAEKNGFNFYSEYKDYEVASIEVLSKEGLSGQLWLEEFLRNSARIAIWDRKRPVFYKEISDIKSKEDFFNILDGIVDVYF